MFLSVIIPAYNEEKNIAQTIRKVSDYLAKQPYDWEILVVNDGSTDRTREIVQSLNLPRLILIDNPKNQGKGFVLRQGFLRAMGECRLFMDADYSTPIEAVEKLLLCMPPYDMVIGSRALKESVIQQAQPGWRIIAGKVFKKTAKAFLGIRNISDTQCGFKMLTAQAANQIVPLCQTHGWAFDVELIGLAQKMGYAIKEVPVTWHDNRESKVRLADAVKIAKELKEIKWNLRNRSKNTGR